MATDHAYYPIPVLTGPGIYGTFGVGQAIQTTEVSVRWMTLGCIIPAFHWTPQYSQFWIGTWQDTKVAAAVSLTTVIIGIVFHLPLPLSELCFTYHCHYRYRVSLTTVSIGIVFHLSLSS